MSESNPHWQDKMLGGAILSLFVAVALVAAVVALVRWGAHERTASNAIHASKHHSRSIN